MHAILLDEAATAESKTHRDIGEYNNKEKE